MTTFKRYMKYLAAFITFLVLFYFMITPISFSIGFIIGRIGALTGFIISMDQLSPMSVPVAIFAIGTSLVISFFITRKLFKLKRKQT